MDNNDILNQLLLLQQSGVMRLMYLAGLIETVTAVPTYTPVKFFDQFKIYVDNITSPTIRKLYFYSNQTNSWLFLDAGAGDVTGPASATADNFAAFDGATGKLLKDSGKKASDFADATLGVTNGNAHNHSGGDGAQIDYNNLANLPSIPAASPSWQIVGLVTVSVESVSVSSAYNDATVMFTAECADSASPVINRWAKDNGIWYRTHTVTDTDVTADADSERYVGMAVLGSYVYIFIKASGSIVQRYSATDLTGKTSMSFSGTNASGFGNGAMPMFTDGTYLYLGEDVSHTTSFYKFSVSGTTITNVGTVSYTSLGGTNQCVCWCDGVSVYFANNSAPYDGSVVKYPLAGGAATSTTTRFLCARLGSLKIRGFAYNSSTVYSLAHVGSYDGASQQIHLFDITKP
jgi:hypothetical protein